MRALITRAALLTIGLALLAPSLGAQGRRDTIRRARIPIPNQFIVVLAGNDDADAVALETKVLRRGQLKHVFRHTVKGFAIRLTRAQAQALADDPRVAFVEEDGLVHASLTDYAESWGLDRIDQRALPLDGSYWYPSPTRPVRIHVLDTGVRITHLAFGGRAFNAGDFVDDDLDWDETDVGNDDGNPSAPDGADCNGHGTHVAATAAGAGFGVARHAIVMSYRVLDCHGDGTISSVIAGVDAVTADTYRPAVANMSLSGDISEALDAAVRRSIAAGIPYVVAAGNNNVDASTASPARVAEAITVGATADNDARANFSNYGGRIDLFAPGVSIPSAWYSSDSAASTLSGTSMAAPHVAGVAALYLEEHPAATPTEVRAAIVTAATTGVVTNIPAGTVNRLLFSRLTAAPPATGAPLPAPWLSADIGPVLVAGSASLNAGTFELDGSGSDIWNNADQFRFAYQALSGDGVIVAQVTGVQNVAAWTKAGIMIRSSLDPGAANAALVVTPANGLSFQRRASAGGTTVTTVASGGPPAWVRLKRVGNVFSAYRSTDGATWTLIERATISMGTNVLVGMAVTSQSPGRLARGSFASVGLITSSSTTTEPTPAPTLGEYKTLDIGTVGIPGSATANADGSFTLTGAGADVWYGADAFRYLHQQVTGDFDVETRVSTLDPVHPWSKAGVMIRDSLDPGSRQAFAIVSPGSGLALQFRGATDGASSSAAKLTGSAPYWVKLSRRGSTISAYARTDSGSWALMGTTAVSFGSTVYVGAAITSHDVTRAASATFSNLRIVQ